MLRSMSALAVNLLLLTVVSTVGAAKESRGSTKQRSSPKDDPPLYPITASWFSDRFTKSEWNRTLEAFTAQGGHTVWLRAPKLVVRSTDDIRNDPDFTWCGSTKSASGGGGTHCVTEAQTDIKAAGLTAVTWMTYKYEEDFSDVIMACPQMDRKINSSRIYYRLVIPLNRSDCTFNKGDIVAVVLTMFSGTDPHVLLADVATTKNTRVYFGLPASPSMAAGSINSALINAYFNFVGRVLADHQKRYMSLTVISEASAPTPLYDVIKGYYSTDEVLLAEVSITSSFYLAMYKTLGTMVKSYKKKFVLSPYIILNKSLGNYSLEQHVIGFEAIAKTGVVDVIAVQEGRGCGKGAYFYDVQIDRPIRMVDPGLDKIIRYLDPKVPSNVTYREQFTASNQLIFKALAESRDSLSKQGLPFELWLNIEAFEYLRDDPCLPVDRAGSGMAELLDRTSKSRLDWALTAAGSRPQNVISFAWDSDFTCTTQKYRASLASEIRRDFGRPILSECRWHSPQNMSIVILGFNLAGETQSFEVHWPDRHGKTRVDKIYGYYFELDYGYEHQRLPGLQYTMLYNIMDLPDLRDHGNIIVKADGAFHPCMFTY